MSSPAGGFSTQQLLVIGTTCGVLLLLALMSLPGSDTDSEKPRHVPESSEPDAVPDRARVGRPPSSNDVRRQAEAALAIQRAYQATLPFHSARAFYPKQETVTGALWIWRPQTWRKDLLLPFAIEKSAFNIFWGDAARRATDRNSTSNCRVLNAGDFDLPWYQKVLDVFHYGIHRHRKQMEYVWIYRTVTSMLADRFQNGREVAGLGFDVGQAPLPSAFVAAGATKLVITGMPSDDAAALGWQKSKEYGAALEANFDGRILEKDKFFKAASYVPANMAKIPAVLLTGGFDFVWSCSAVERHGTLKLVEQFILNTALMLKPGGVAVHTTEFIITHLVHTVEYPRAFTLLRLMDVELIAEKLQLAPYNARMTTRDYFAGDQPHDRRCDDSPFHGHYHFKLRRPPGEPDACHTNILLVIQKNELLR